MDIENLFIEINDDSFESVIEDFKSKHPNNKKHGLSVAEIFPNEEAIPLEIYPKALPRFEELACVAADLCSDYFEKHPGNSQATGLSRNDLISSIMDRFVVVDIFGRKYIHGKDLPRENMLDSNFEGIVKIGQKNGYLTIKAISKNPIKVSIPSVGKIEIKPCPFCGKYNLLIPSETMLLHPNRSNIHMKCVCGASLSVPSYRFRCIKWKYSTVINHLIDIWNERE